MSATIEQLRERAAQEIERRGWVQGHGMIGNTGPCCLLGAIMSAGAKDPDWDGSVEALRREMLTQLDCASLIIWNDQPGRTREEVLAALRRTV